MSIQLPADAEARSQNFPRLSPETKKKLIESVRSKAPEEQGAAIETILRQSGTASEFFQHLLTKETDPMIPHNKRTGPIQFK